MNTEKKDDKQPAAAGKAGGGKKEPRQPRAKGDVAHDFRMASFFGKIVRVVESWSKGRSLSIVVETEDHKRAAQGLERFMSSDEILFRLVPRQPLIGDKDPEDFSLKVPRFCVEMVERLEKKASEGVHGWETMHLREHLIHAGNAHEMLCCEIDKDKPNPKQLQKLSIDLANYAFFVWQLTGIMDRKASAEG
jgi:hypothetical protein